ncbi:MAG: trimethylamine methyltransferase family protein [Deltaproteobacteria bacterium]|jgi:trimethylamine--corrinoid protein Co-methyltransferase|nr:trimethylamine methyltransferase family protein [Deltaproteobacteria bacterium]
MNFYNFFTDEQKKNIHEASLTILEDTGMVVKNQDALEIFVKHGCKADGNRVRFPRKIVEDKLTSVPPTYTFTAQVPELDVTLPGDRPVIVTGSSAPNVVDPVTGEERRGTSHDVANIAYLINELKGFDVYSISILADDAPPDMRSLYRFYPALKNCKKPVRSNTPSIPDLEKVLDLGYTIAGSKEAYFKRPFINHHYCPVISPLTYDVESTASVVYLAKLGLPVYGTIVPNAGMTSPMSLLGTLTMGNAEFLSLAFLMQAIKPGSGVIYAVLSTVGDMRNGDYAPGAIETGILQMGHSEMARFYNVPSGGYIGLTNSQSNDVQNGYETSLNTAAALLAGSDLFNMGGLLGGLMAFDFSKAVIDNEIALNLKHLKKGIPYDPNDFCLELINKTGPGGNYMVLPHTAKNLRKVTHYPTIGVRGFRSKWINDGKPNAETQAAELAKKILTKPNPNALAADIDKKVRDHIPGLPEGQAYWYE